jgi:hypothetical protein
MKIEDIIKELTNICEDIYELHNLIICNKLFKLNKNIKPHISKQLYINYNKELENLFFESFINESKINNEIKIIMNEIIYLISEIISSLNKLLLNYP